MVLPELWLMWPFGISGKWWDDVVVKTSSCKESPWPDEKKLFVLSPNIDLTVLVSDKDILTPGCGCVVTPGGGASTPGGGWSGKDTLCEGATADPVTGSAEGKCCSPLLEGNEEEGSEHDEKEEEGVCSCTGEGGPIPRPPPPLPRTGSGDVACGGVVGTVIVSWVDEGGGVVEVEEAQLSWAEEEVEVTVGLEDEVLVPSTPSRSSSTPLHPSLSLLFLLLKLLFCSSVGVCLAELLLLLLLLLLFLLPLDFLPSLVDAELKVGHISLTTELGPRDSKEPIFGALFSLPPELLLVRLLLLTVTGLEVHWVLVNIGLSLIPVLVPILLDFDLK